MVKSACVDSKIDYKKLLDNSYSVASEMLDCPPESRLEYLGDYIFNFITYDREVSTLFARKAVEVCAAINKRLTFEYIKELADYQWFLLMCNVPFFRNKLEWGSSIRGAWWGAMPGKRIEFKSCGLWIGDEQLHKTMEFSREEWEMFIAAVIEFAEVEMRPDCVAK